MAQGKEFTKEQKETIIQSLKPYLEMGFSRNRACESIGLTPATLSTWLKNDESLLMKITGWENYMNTIAVNNIAKAIQKEAELDDDIKKENSWKWAERKMKDEFSIRTETTGKDGRDLFQDSESIKKQIEEVLDDIIDDTKTEDQTNNS